MKTGLTGQQIKGDTNYGHLWVMRDSSKQPRDVSSESFELRFGADQDVDEGDPAWLLTTSDGLTKMDGDGRVVTLCNGESLTLTELGFDYIVAMDPAIPPFSVGSWYWKLKGTVTGTPDIVTTYEVGRMDVVLS